MTQPPQRNDALDAYVAANIANSTASGDFAGNVLAVALHSGTSVAQARSMVATVIRVQSGRAVRLADLAVAEMTDADPLGLTLPDPSFDAIGKAVETLLPAVDEDEALDLDPDELDTLSTRVSRLAEAVPLDAGADALHTAMDESEAVTGWRRRVAPDCCAMCQKLATDEVFPLSVNMIRHPNDRCVAEPVVTESEEGHPHDRTADHRNDRAEHRA